MGEDVKGDVGTKKEGSLALPLPPINTFFAILPEDHPTRFKPYWDVRDAANDALVDVGAVGRIATADPVKTGFALTLTRTSKIKEVLRHAEAIKIALGADEVALRKSSITMVISDVPVRVAGSSSPISDLDPFLADEIELALDAKLACPPRRMCKPEHLAARTTTGVWIAIDPDSPDAARPRRIRLMQRWCHMRPFIDRSIPTPCDNCWSFGHSDDACSHPPRCQQCTSGAHGSEDHTCDLCGGHGTSKCVPLCNSCTGPHLPGDSSCKANPTFDSSVNGYIVPIGRRLQQIKQAASKDRVEAVKRLQKSLLAPSR
ncbi:hypothetical protein CF319_g9056 [Tilletia indica]|nr:hypothetical protein CF319_g9056 [Tilletia indica]